MKFSQVLVLLSACSSHALAATSAASAPALNVTAAAGQILGAIENAGSCLGCQDVVVLLKGIATLGDDAFVATITDLCKLTKAEDDDVCEGAVRLEGPIIAADLRAMFVPSHTSDLFCVTFLGLCAYPDVVPYQVTFPKPKPPTKRPKPSGKTPIQIVHYSDIHVDPFYTTGANYNCTKPICCRVYDSGDAPGNNSFPAGPWGNHECDAPQNLEVSMYKAIKQIVPGVKFSLFTGDIVDHAIWETSQAQNTLDINSAYKDMSDSLSLVYGTAGNHESSPVNAFQTLAEGNGDSWVYNVLTAAWTKWIGATAASTASTIGAYSVKYPGGNLKVISLNTNFYYIQNYWLYETIMEKDPSGQFAWLVKELQAAEDAGQRVYMLGHMPMGLPDAFHDYSNYFDQIINRYSETIAGLFFGHTHDDEFEIGYSDYSHQTYSNAVAVSYIGPSLTPTSGSPSFRVYNVDPETFAVLDSITYIANISDPTYQTQGPKWKKYYSAKEVYGPLVSPKPGAHDELSPAFWHNVTVAFENDSKNLNAYISRKSRGYNPASCTGSCATSEICQIRAMRSQDNCYMPKLGVHFSKRDVARHGGVEHHDECGVSVTRRALGFLAMREDAVQLLVRAVEKR